MTHLVFDIQNCKFYSILYEHKVGISVINFLATMAKSELLKTTYHKFEPHGYTALGLLSTSHISIHTFPETKSIAIDLYTCLKLKEKTIQKIVDYVGTLCVKDEKDFNYVIIDRIKYKEEE